MKINLIFSEICYPEHYYIMSGEDKTEEKDQKEDRKGKSSSVSKPKNRKEPESQNVTAMLNKLNKRNEQLENEFKESNKKNEIITEVLQKLGDKVASMNDQLAAAQSQSSQSVIPGCRNEPVISKNDKVDYGYNGPDIENDQDQEEKEMEEDFSFGKETSRSLAPDDKQVIYWKSYRKVSEDHDEEAWQKINCNKLVSYYTGNKGAKEFKCHEKDMDAPDLKYDNVKVSEKALKGQEMFHGAIGMAVTNIMVTVEDMIANMKDAASDFLGSKEMADPRQDASDLCLDMQDVLAKQISPHLDNIAKMSAIGYNKALIARRNQYIDMVPGNRKQLKDKLRKMAPSDGYVFGGKIEKLAKAYKNESMVCLIC